MQLTNKDTQQEKIYRNMLQPLNSSFDVSKSHLSFAILADNLKKLGDGLQLTIRETEKEFLSIGSGLREFYSRAENISKMSSDIAQLFSGTEISESIQRLNTLVTRMNDSMEHARHETADRIEKLKYLMNTTSTIHDLLENLKTSIKSLKMLGLTTRIYSNNAVSFNVLSTDVKRLAGDMTLKTASILDGLKSLNMKIKETLSKVISLNDIQKNKAQQIIEDTMTSFSSLADKHALSSTITEDISRLSEDTSGSIAEVVKFLQFHDIIYQQIGQIRDEFYSLHGRLEGMRYDEYGDEIAVRESLMQTRMFCDMQANKLNQYRYTIETAVNSIIGNLQNINRNVINISQGTRQLTGDTGEKGLSFLSETKKSLTAVSSAITALADNAKASKELSKALSSIVLDEIAAFLKDIGPIEDEIELISLNAVVTASNMDKGGEVLNVIAESVQKLALEVRRQTGSVLHIFKSMTSVTGELSAEIDSANKRDAEIYDMAAEVELLIGSFSRINGEIASLLAAISRDGRKLSEDIELTVRGIYINEMFAKACDKTIAEIGHIASLSCSMLPDMGILKQENIPFGFIEDQLLSTGRKCISEKNHTDVLPEEQDNGKKLHYETNVELF